MRIIHNTIGLFIILCLCFACSLKEDVFEPQASDGIIQLNAAVADFSEHNVSTKAGGEADINELTMFVFTAAGNIVGEPVNIEGSNPTFLISTTRNDELGIFPYIWDPNATGDEQYIEITNGDDDLHYCDIYMVANAWDTLKDKVDEIETLAALKAVSIPVSGIDIPENGFPMIGKQTEGTFDLASVKLSGTTGGNTLATITMKKLYAKVTVRFQLIADQVVLTPSFSLTDWQVRNIPSTVSLGEAENGLPTANTRTDYIQASQKSNVLTAGDRNIQHSASGSSYFEFSFYLPEHHLYAPQNETTFGYPAGMPEENRQRYKPLLCGEDQYPTYVRVHGSYKDHQGNAKEVTYDVYLGQDPVDDFCVKRNQLLNNIITLKGITDSNPYYDGEGNLVYPDDYTPGDDKVSVDHRVEIGSQGVVISLEREAVMDSHFEVRPMDITVSDGTRVVVTIDDESNTDPNGIPWMRFEVSGNSGDHISDVGVRKYFTTDLVTSTLNADVNKTLTITEDTRLWLYFDENTNVYDSYLDTDEENPLPKWRDIKLKVDYYASGNNTSTPDNPMVYTFRQWHLWRIRDKSNTRYYDIEHEEEYLYNYVSDDNYGKTTDGMAWGLNGITFSGNMGDDLKTQAVVIETSGWSSDIIDEIINSASPFYDFYLPREARDISTSLVKPLNEYAGKRFSDGIIDSDPDGTGEYVSISQIKRELNDSPVSAIEYCLNKNRRSSTGLVTDRDWYLPAIDEIEQIMVGGYSQFDVFQDKEYWSCQPSFHKNHFLYSATLISNSDFKGDYYYENSLGARATSAVLVGTDLNGDLIYDYAGSGAINDGYYGSLEISYTENDSSNNTHIIPEEGRNIQYWDGTREWLIFPVYTTIHLDKIEYDVGYNDRKDDLNRVRCVYRSGLISSLPADEQ